MANSLTKRQRKSAFVYARNRILKGKNIDEWGKIGMCTLLAAWLKEKGPEFADPTHDILDPMRWFPEFVEEEPIVKIDNGPDEGMWFPEDDDASRVEVLNKCINKLS